MEYEQPVHYGYLLLPPMGKILIKKSLQQKYCLLFKASKFGIERLEVYDSADSTKTDQPKIITLENCVKINAKTNTSFTVITKTATYDFTATDNHSMTEWLTAIQSVAFPDNASKITTIEEDNDLYCSSGEGVFNVVLHPSDVSTRCGLEKYQTYILVLTSNSIQLRNSSDCKLLYTWPYCYIRRYGIKNGKFTFEAGRKCESGEGTFLLEHSNLKEIFRCLTTKMNTMKKLLNENMPTPMVEDDSLQVALSSMEAKSRSPIPPSINSSTTNIISLENSSKLSNKLASLQLNELKVKPKTIPSKPPRKYVNNKSDYEPIDKYDEIEYRNNAWRTMGVDDVKHTEQINNDEEESSYVSWGCVKEQVKRIETNLQPKPAKVLPAVSPQNLDSYDKLNFFGSTSKLDVTSGYKQVIPPPRELVVLPPSFNEYDEIQPWSSEDIRPADDSHLGYALVRKDTTNETNPFHKKDKVDNVSHHFHNDEPYAVISKPKRV